MTDLALFNLEPERRPITLEPHDGPFVPVNERLCGMCRKPMKRLSWAYGCGSASGEGMYVICDDCACDDYLPGTTRSRWGLSREFLAIDRTRRKVYAAGGGETEVHAALVEAGLA